MKLGSTSALVACVCAGVFIATASGGAQQTPPTPPQAPGVAPQAGGGRGLGDACGGRSATPQVPCENDVNRMMAVLPAKAPATPAKPRKVLVLGMVRGFQHSSIPLAGRMIEEMGKKTGAWTADISYDASVVNTENLKQYDAIFLSSTTGCFLDDPNDEAATTSRRQALLDFVRGGKGLAGIHAASDSYHGTACSGGGRGRGAGAPGGAPPQATGAAAGAAPPTAAPPPPPPPPPAAGGGRQGGGRGQAAPCSTNTTPGGGGGQPLWPDFNKMIGGYFKHHWNWPTPITVKIDDPKSPINAAFKGQSFNTMDETYTFNETSWSRENVRVLTSVDYSLMNGCDKGLESNPRPDHDYGLSWIRREGNGRVFYQALGHHESIYYNNPAMLEHILAGMQYALGDLKADDSPSRKK